MTRYQTRLHTLLVQLRDICKDNPNADHVRRVTSTANFVEIMANDDDPLQAQALCEALDMSGGDQMFVQRWLAIEKISDDEAAALAVAMIQRDELEGKLN